MCTFPIMEKKKSFPFPLLHLFCLFCFVISNEISVQSVIDKMARTIEVFLPNRHLNCLNRTKVHCIRKKDCWDLLNPLSFSRISPQEDSIVCTEGRLSVAPTIVLAVPTSTLHYDHQPLMGINRRDNNLIVSLFTG